VVKDQVRRHLSRIREIKISLVVVTHWFADPISRFRTADWVQEVKVHISGDGYAGFRHADGPHRHIHKGPTGTKPCHF